LEKSRTPIELDVSEDEDCQEHSQKLKIELCNRSFCLHEAQDSDDELIKASKAKKDDSNEENHELDTTICPSYLIWSDNNCL
jgi:hypothetical protein